MELVEDAPTDSPDVPVFPFTVTAEQHAELAALVGDLDVAMNGLSAALSSILTVLGSAAADGMIAAQDALVYADAEQGVLDFGGGEDAAV